MKDTKRAPIAGCKCEVCTWANRKAATERRLAEDLEANYQRYLSGTLVSRLGRE